MKATIVGVNPNKGRAVALTSDGQYALLELLGDEPELGDEISGNFEEMPLGGEMLHNITAKAELDVFIQDYCSRSMAEQYLGRKTHG